MKADYHIHSEFSDDSFEAVEDQINKAISLKFNEICFCDHVDYGIKKDWSEGNIEYRDGDGISNDNNMKEPLANVDYPRYFEKLNLMKEEYKDKIIIKKGLEFGIQRHTIDKYERLFKEYENELDFVLLSVHQIDDKELWNQEFQKDKSQKEYHERYYQEIYETMNQYKNYCVLAHLDLISRYDLKEYPFENNKKIITEILKQAIQDDKGIEINTSSYHYKLKDTTPSMDILKLYHDLGGKIITIGSDAHSTKYLGDHYDDARKILKDIGFKYICTFDKMTPIFHNL